MLSINTDKKQIRLEAIAGAKGLAIFNGFRAGMYLAGAGGSGIVVSRLPDGSWSVMPVDWTACGQISEGFWMIHGLVPMDRWIGRSDA
jgi:lipid-binding SYLF domain-containing protein